MIETFIMKELNKEKIKKKQVIVSKTQQKYVYKFILKILKFSSKLISKTAL